MRSGQRPVYAEVSIARAGGGGFLPVEQARDESLKRRLWIPLGTSLGGAFAKNVDNGLGFGERVFGELDGVAMYVRIGVKSVRAGDVGQRGFRPRGTKCLGEMFLVPGMDSLLQGLTGIDQSTGVAGPCLACCGVQVGAGECELDFSEGLARLRLEATLDVAEGFLR